MLKKNKIKFLLMIFIIVIVTGCFQEKTEEISKPTLVIKEILDTELKLAAPSNIRITINGTNTNIKWDENKEIEKYSVYIKKKNGNWIKAEKVKETEVDIELDYNAKYYLKIRGEDEEGETGMYSAVKEFQIADEFENPIEMSLRFDDCPEQISWELKDSDNNVMYSGGSYGNEFKQETITKIFILEEGEYTYTINDSYGDGLSDSGIEGYYSLADENGLEIVKTVGDFGTTDSITFIVKN